MWGCAHRRAITALYRGRKSSSMAWRVAARSLAMGTTCRGVRRLSVVRRLTSLGHSMHCRVRNRSASTQISHPARHTKRLTSPSLQSQQTHNAILIEGHTHLLEMSIPTCTSPPIRTNTTHSCHHRLPAWNLNNDCFLQPPCATHQIITFLHILTQ